MAKVYQVMLALNQEVDGIKVPDIKICIFGDSFPQKRFCFNSGSAYTGSQLMPVRSLAGHILLGALPVFIKLMF